MMKLFLILLALVFSAATQELKEKSIIVNKSTETKTMRDDDEDPPPPPPPDQKINTNETQSQKVDKTKEVPITVKENETVGNGTKRTSGGKKARTITRKQKQKNEKSPTKESWSNPITVQDGEVIDYGNGTVVRISRVEKSRIIKQNQNQPNEKSPRLEIWRRLIEETIGKIVNNTIRPQYDGILKEIRTIKDKQQNIDNKIGVIEKSQKDFSDRIIKERDLDRNATKQFQSALEAIQNNQQTMKDDLSKSMVNTTNKIANQLEGNLIKQEKERGRIHEALSKIDNDIKNVESEIKNKVEPVQNIVARGLKDINEREKNKTNVNIEEIMKKILEKEMAVVQMFSKNVSQNMDKIQKLSNDSNKSILNIKEQLTKGIESINKDNGLNGQKLVNDVHAVIHENGALFQNALSLAQKQSHNDIIDTKYKLIKELQNLNTELHKRLKEQNDTINGAKKVILSDIWNIKEDLTKHKKDQKTFLELILRIQETIREDIKNATYEKMKNVPFVEIEKYIENARSETNKDKGDTRIINRNDEDAFEKTENKDHRRNTGIDWDDNGTNNWDDNKTNKDQNDSLKNRIKDQLKETLKEDRLERTEKDPVKDTGLDWDDNETNKDKGNTQDKTNQDDYDKTENKDPGWRYYTKSARSKKDIPKTTFKKWDLKARILDTLGKNL
ncbi:hypothetical protein M8J75_009204 [Diaphorina citri]|nr:hypothetical protein M8J75_009204 [Diaphorina citri]